MKFEITIKRMRDGLVTRFVSGDMTREVLDACVTEIFEADGLCKVIDIQELEGSQAGCKGGTQPQTSSVNLV